MGILPQGSLINTNDPPVRLNLDAGTENYNRLSLFEAFLTLWCQSNCKASWKVRQETDTGHRYQLVVEFTDPREALLFKLMSPRFNLTDVTH